MTQLYYAQDISLGWPAHPAKNIWRHVERLGIVPVKNGLKYALNEAQVAQLEKLAHITIPRKKDAPAPEKRAAEPIRISAPQCDTPRLDQPTLKQRKTRDGKPYLLAAPVTAVPKPWQWSASL